MNNFAAKEFWSIVVGGSMLAVNAGFINVVTLAGLFQVPVSHVTGNVSKVAIFIFQEDFTNFILITSILFSFMFGSFIAGIVVGDNKFRLGRGYGYAILVESAALFGSYFFLKRELVVGEWCAAFACGLQNALATSYSGAVVRTTHMTGICTDIGNILGQACRKDSKAELWKLKVFVPILLSFMFGGFLGQACYLLMHENAILLPCFFTGGMGVLYLSLPFVKRAGKTLAEITAFEKANGVELTTKGDPSKVKPDYFQAILGKDVDLEVKNFMAELDQPTVKVVDQEKPDLAESRKTSFISKLKSSSNKSKDIELHTAKNGATFNQFLADAEDESFANLIAETVPAQPSDHKMFS